MLLIGGASQAEAMEVWQSTLQGNGHIVRKHVVEGFAYSKEGIEALASIISAHGPKIVIMLRQEGGGVSDHIRLATEEAIKMGASSARIVSLPEICVHAAIEGAAASGSKSGLPDEAVAMDAMDQAEWAPLLASRRGQGHPELPLVSVLIRSMDRPELREALDSVALQTWPNIEVCVINATGEQHSNLPEEVAGLAVRLLSAETRLDRSDAANMGLECARGEFLIFLDDDDVLFPTHLERLCAALMCDGAGRRVAYAGVELVDEGGKRIRVLDEVWDARRLRGANYIPIHALMFAGDLVRKNAFMFDTRLSCLEDWDFWLQLSTATDFIHVPGVSALYRFSLGQSAISGAADQGRYLESRRLIFDKWKDRFALDAWVETFTWFDSAFSHYLERTIHFERKANEFEHSRNVAMARGEALEHENARLRLRLEHAERQVEHGELRAQHLQAQLADERQRIAAIFNSTSWKVSRPVRVVKRLMLGERKAVLEQARKHFQVFGRSIYSKLPLRLAIPARSLAYRLAGPVFRGMPSYDVWSRSAGGNGQNMHGQQIASGQLVRITDVKPLPAASPGSVAIHLHLYYEDLAGEFRACFEAMPYLFDLYVSVATQQGADIARSAFADLPKMQTLELSLFPNRGRDIAPMVAGFGDRLSTYDYVAHLHSKKSLYNQGATDGWRNYLCQSLFGDEDNIRRIFRLLETHGMVYPQMFWRLPYSACTWLGNVGVGRQLLGRLGLPMPRTAYFDFPAGSMFWARGDTLRPLLNAGINFDDFPPEAGQTDGTLAHAVERALGCLDEASGRKGPAVIADTVFASWSAWRVDQYVGRTRSYALQQLDDPALRVCVFDIFDTLLVRSFCDAEHVKRVTALRAGAEGDAYLRLRAEAESMARARSERDVGLDDIYRHLRAMAGWSLERAAEIQELERVVEQESVLPREDGVFLYNQAMMRGKRLVLASDMYLDPVTIDRMLRRHGVAGWHALLVSSDVGVRKDSGRLFERVLSDEGVSAANVLVVGDNERSDLQIPGDMGAKVIHLMRHPDLAQALPRLSSLMVRPELREDLDWSVSMGLITRRFFSPVFFDDFDPSALFGRSDAFAVGFGVLGPLVLSFVQWLVRRAQLDGHDRLWFLAREGQLIHEVYQAYTAGLESVPQASYLRLSRRAVSVPAITGADDIERIAAENFGPASLGMLLEERYGVTLNAEDDGLLSGGCAPQADTRVMIRGGNTSAAMPALRYLEGRILSQAQNEREPLFRYLESIGWDREVPQAVVDVGYGGSIQSYLNALLGQPVRGYYMLTNHRTAAVRERFGVDCAGCFHESVDLTAELPRMYAHNFILEKLMSADDPQVVRYRLDEGGRVEPVFKSLSEAELSARPLRAAIRSGAMAYVNDFLAESQRLGVQLQCPVDLSRTLYELFADGANDAERGLLSGLSLDDHYCGRGVVS